MAIIAITHDDGTTEVWKDVGPNRSAVYSRQLHEVYGPPEPKLSR